MDTTKKQNIVNISSPPPQSVTPISIASPTTPAQTYYGVTEPISLSHPSVSDIKMSKDLENTLVSLNLFESSEESRLREEVLGKLDQIVKQWAIQVSLVKGYTDQMANEVVAKIFTFGSFRLGVHGPGSDIDTLCVGPKHIMRSDFFDYLGETLKVHPDVTEYTTVKDAFVPVIKMIFSGISIDLLYARLSLPVIAEDLNDLVDEKYLKDVDEKSILSLNGCRVTDKILSLVPNKETFRLALRCIKVWAQNRGVYSNVLGLLGGVSWALLTARICQLYPNASASTIVNRFFKIYEGWKWPQPILLCPIQDGGSFAAKVWNQKRDKTHLMPILTPAYPSMNSTYNVSRSTLSLLRSEFIRGAEVTKKIEAGESTWLNLLDKCDFFTRYSFYIQIDCNAANEEEHRKWEGWIESKLRLLISGLEQTPNMKFAVPFPKCFENKAVAASHGEQYKCTSFFMGLQFNFSNLPGADKSVNLTRAVSDFTNLIKDWNGKIQTMDMSIHYIKKKDLPSFIPKEYFVSHEQPKQPKKRNSTGQNVNNTAANTSNTSSPTASSATNTTPPAAGVDIRKKTKVDHPQSTATATTITTTTPSTGSTNQPQSNGKKSSSPAVLSPAATTPITSSTTTTTTTIETKTDTIDPSSMTTTAPRSQPSSPTLNGNGSSVVNNQNHISELNNNKENNNNNNNIDNQQENQPIVTSPSTLKPQKEVTTEVTELDFISGSKSVETKSTTLKKPSINLIKS